VVCCFLGFFLGKAKEGLLKKVKVDPSAARKQNPDPASVWRAALTAFKNSSINTNSK
jgi:hypothetical protein